MNDLNVTKDDFQTRSREVEVSFRGRLSHVPFLRVNGQTIVVTGSWVKTAALFDEDWLDADGMLDADQIVTKLRDNKEVTADVFTFSQKCTDPVPHYEYRYELDSVAAIPLLSYADWWQNRVSSDLRKDVRRAAKRGVVVRAVPFTDDLVGAIMGIYDETPIRQGRNFWHYKKGFDAVKRANATYRERSEFIGAYLEEELIGFLKIVYTVRVARLMQILSKDAYRKLRPMNALIAKAVELTSAKGCTLLTYGKFRYAQGADSVTAFKARNGFEEILVPKFYVPITVRGSIALKLHLHRAPGALIPGFVRRALRELRSSINRRALLTRNARFVL